MEKTKKPKTVLTTLSASHRDIPQPEDGGSDSDEAEDVSNDIERRKRVSV